MATHISTTIRRGLVGFCLLLLVAGGWRAEAASSRSYQIKDTSFNAGGGTSTSARYAAEMSLGGLGGSSSSASGLFSSRDGFVGVVNDPPLARPDAVNRAAGQPLTIPIAQLLSNDSDPEGQPIVFQSASPTSARGVTIVRNGPTLIYQSNSTTVTNDTFTYTIGDDSGVTAIGLVTVITGVSPGPSHIGVERLAASSFRITVTGVAGVTYAIQSLDQLGSGTWTELQRGAAAGDGTFVFTDQRPAAQRSRFYRATVP